MSHQNAHLIDTHDGVICRTLLSFLSAPLLLLMSAATLIAL
jgi:hypothetical protein